VRINHPNGVTNSSSNENPETAPSHATRFRYSRMNP